jgi:Asp-tRNA(Asn)/Glu-tRNA(Gln) amidotransferase C subunit
MQPRQPSKPDPLSPGGTPTPVSKQLQEARLAEARLEEDLAAARQKTLALEQRLAVDALSKAIGSDALVQAAVNRLNDARIAFEASLNPPADFDAANDGNYEDTDDFADIRAVERAVDDELVGAVRRITESTANDAAFASGMRQLCSVTHYVARVSEIVDDGNARLKEAAIDVVEDLRDDVAEAWREVGACEGAATWKPTVLALLERECGGYYPESIEAVSAW